MKKFAAQHRNVFVEEVKKKGDFCTKIEMPTKGNLEDFAKQ